MDYREGPMVSVREFCEIHEIAVPIKKEVCPVCEGHGIHVNPAIDSHGISSEEFWDDPDFGGDRGLGDLGTRLAMSARAYGSQTLMLGHDGKIYN